MQSGASGFSGLMFGRTFVGLGVGFGLAVDPVYIGEISQAAHRGQLVTWSEIAVSCIESGLFPVLKLCSDCSHVFIFQNT